MGEALQLLQINIVSARDLAPVSKSMQTYAVAWIDPARKMNTRVDEKNTNNPEWNDKFLFRVTPAFLNSESATVVIEIYAQAWLRDVLVGSVRVPIASIIPANPSNQARRAVALQIRRPSSRPRGILNITVSLLDATMRSMPLSGLGSALGYPDEKSRTTRPETDKGSEVASTIRRVKSERTWSVNDEEARPRSACNGPAGSEILPGGSMCNSDVGPSPSVVAAAMAKGLYLPPAPPRGGAVKDDGESSILQWADENSEEGLMTKIERWRMELNRPSHGRGNDQHGASGSGARRSKHRHGRGKKPESGTRKLFRCFGKGYGFEFTIVCGANNGNDSRNNSNNKDKGKKVHHKKQHRQSSDGDPNSPSYLTL